MSDVDFNRTRTQVSVTFRAKAFAMIRLSRPHMFVAGALLYAIGVALSSTHEMRVDISVAISGLIAVFFGQISGQIANDYWDLEGDRESKRTLFSGGSGILTKGLLSPNAALKGAVVSFMIAAVLAVLTMFWFNTGILTLPIILGGTLGGWLYSAEPVRLVSTGFGEVIVSCVVSFFPVMAGFYLQTGTLTFEVLASCTLLAIFLFPVFLSVEFPDRDADVRSGKGNLLVRLGLHDTSRIYAGAMVLPYVALATSVYAGWVVRPTLVIFATLPFALLGASKALGLPRSEGKGAAFVTLTSMVVFVMTMALMLFADVVS